MNTQIRTLSIKLNSANTGKIEYLNRIHEQVKSVARDFLKFKMKQVQDDEEHNYKEEFNERYSKYRQKYPGLNSAILQNTMIWIGKRVKNHISQCKSKHKLVSWPDIQHFPIAIRNQISSFINDDRHFEAWFRFTRTNFPLRLCDFHQKVLDKTKDFGDSQLIKRDGDWYLQLVCKVECEHPSNMPDNTMGIDLGIVNPIVCSDRKRIGNGSRITHKQKEFQKKRSSQQSNNKEITKKQRRWMKDKNHKLSQQLIDYAVTSGAGVLVLEDLKGQHLSNGRWRQYKWSFAELLEFIQYKAEAAGMKVISVDPAYTSQTCSNCGQKSPDNRKTRSYYECSNCGYRADADVNAAKNICALSGEYGPPVDQARAKA